MEKELTVFVEDLQRVAPAFIEGYVVIDHERKVVDFNPTFFSMLPRDTGRGLIGKPLAEVFVIDQPDEDDIIDRCWLAKKHVRIDDIEGAFAGASDEVPQRFTVSAMPLFSSDGKPIGAFVLLKVVTSEVELQARYQSIVDGEADQRHRLEERLKIRTAELLRAHRDLEDAQQQLLDFKRGLLV